MCSSFKNNQKLVSVNITTYNRADLLGRCLDSVLRQTYKNLEILVVDDCSSDLTVQVMRQYTHQYNHIKYIRHEKNKGNAFARNTALNNCNGFYVAFMDDDDEWIDINKIYKQVEIFESNCQNRLGIVCSSVKILDGSGNETLKIEKKPKDIINHILRKNGIIHNSTVMTKKSVMEEIGGFDTFMPKGVDSEFFRTLIVKHKYDVYFMPDITTAYYEHLGNRMTTNQKKLRRKTLIGNYRVISKHFFSFLKNPDALFYRLGIMLKKLI